MSTKTRNDHLQNIVLGTLSVIALVIAGFLLEFEVSKARSPEVSWPNTPSELVLAVAGTLALGSLIVLSILALIYKKDLYNRPYLWWITGFLVATGIVTITILAKDIGLGTLINFVLFP